MKFQLPLIFSIALSACMADPTPHYITGDTSPMMGAGVMDIHMAGYGRINTTPYYKEWSEY